MENVCSKGQTILFHIQCIIYRTYLFLFCFSVYIGNRCMHYEVVQWLYLLLDIFPPARDRLKSFQVRPPGVHNAERSTAQTESLIPDNISPLSALAFPSSFPFLFSFFSSSPLASPKPFSSLTFLINKEFLWCTGGEAAKRSPQRDGFNPR